ncbi:MAG: AmmeMemoRadiSam system protein B [Nanoarchaeota archaeon]|nr:AmmeMemoRadiSam system protein B [Nanoarchaeota archaeon]
MTRQPIAANSFYPDDFTELDKQINECFSSKFGPGALPITKRDKNTIGIISPHAGYMFSGPCQAWAYKEIAESIFPDTFIMLGLSHNGCPSCLSLEDWKTPFGIIRNDKEFQKTLIEDSILKQDEEAHASEHSIEVQLPFLQFANKDNLKKIRIAPIITSPDIHYKDLADYIFKTIQKTKRKAMIIASSDFTHYGLNYGYLPFKDNVKQNMYSLDKGAVNLIQSLDADKFIEYTDKTRATICGKYPIAVLLELSEKLGAQKVKLLHYYTSGDITKDYTNAVGYASIKII